ncbi:HNH endonuclease [Aliarcobacter skirrowii]|uniref:HNH endonuclease n=1 Tax=Aliarcobacter skirrowii TaxID=28200 RepID=UPI003C6C0D42
MEAAHIIPKKDKGNENKENILILCPNHHKEFDYGKRKIIEHTKKEIVFELNEKQYTIKF